jgi:N-methylhydantoinase B/oxoprolinase/acetone carboxylase alpha subunit
VDRGTLREGPTRQLFSNHRYPSRNVDQNLSDLRAQIAANACGMGELHKLVSDFGLETVSESVNVYVGMSVRIKYEKSFVIILKSLFTSHTHKCTSFLAFKFI